MKIRYLIANAFAGGGTIRTTINMANTLSARGHDVEIVSVRRARHKPTFQISPSVTVRTLADQTRDSLDATDSPPLLRRGTKLVRRGLSGKPSRLMPKQERRYDTFDLYTDAQLIKFLLTVRDGVLIGTRPGINLAIARFVRHPSVLRIGQEHLHLSRHRPDLRAAIAKSYPRLHLLTTLTNDDADDYRKLLGADRRIVAMPNAAPDMGGVRAALDNKVVVAAGRLTVQKGFDLLVKAYAQVAAKHPEWQLKIFGGGVKEDELRRLISERDLGSSVQLMGYTTRLADELGAASIYVLSSRFEGFPMVLLEAMMCGLPPVAFDCPTGPRDLIDHGRDGLIVPHKDTDALAAGIIELIEDEQRRKAFGAAAYATAQQYTSEALAQRWEELFTELARERGVTL